MAEILQSRDNLLVEETQYRSALSEALWQKTGGAINFINNEQTIMRSFKLNGVYGSASGTTGLDGLIVFRSNIEIVALTMENSTSGSSGTTTIDIHKLTSPGTDAGSIFSTRPAFDSTSSDDVYFLYNALTASDETPGGLPTGATSPVFSSTTFLKGEAARFDVDTTMIGAENFSLYIYFRPTN